MKHLINIDYPSQIVHRRKPLNLIEGDEYLFQNELTKQLPKVQVVHIKSALVMPNGRLFSGLSLDLNQFNIKPGIKVLLKTYLKTLFSLFKYRHLVKLEKTLYVTNSNSNNFFHWFFDVLQKLEFLEGIHKELKQFGYKIIIPANHRSLFMRETLSAFDFDLIWQHEDEILTCRDVTFVPDIAPTGNFRKELVIRLRERLKKYFISNRDDFNPLNPRVYISRRNAAKRKIINEDEIIPILKANGFAVIDMDLIDFSDQVKLMINSEILISLHGAGLTHMLWMNESAKVMEIRARDDTHNNCYFTLTSDLGLDYYYYIVDKTDINNSTQEADYVVDPAYFESRLLEML